MKRMTKYAGVSWKWRKYMAIEVDQRIKVVVDGWDLSRKGLYGCLRALTEIYSSMAVSACPDQRHGRLPVYFPINGKLQASPAGTVNSQAKRVDCKLTLSVLRCETSDKAS